MSSSRCEISRIRLANETCNSKDFGFNKVHTGGDQMSDAFDERRRGLEEEYFHRKNKEAIEKLREKMKIAEQH